MIRSRALQASLCLVNPSTNVRSLVLTMFPRMTLQVELWPTQQRRMLLRHKPEPLGLCLRSSACARSNLLLRSTFVLQFSQEYRQAVRMKHFRSLSRRNAPVSGLHEKQRLPVALRARCARVFESPHGTTCHAEGGEESPGFLRLPLSRARRVILHSSWLRLCRLESSAGPLFSGLIQWETCRQGRERLSLEA